MIRISVTAFLLARATPGNDSSRQADQMPVAFITGFEGTLGDDRQSQSGALDTAAQESSLVQLTRFLSLPAQPNPLPQ